MQKDQLDISILSADKYLTNDKRKEAFVYNKVKIEEKLDGVKISIFHVDKTGDYTKDFIVAYKSQIIYPSEFDYVVRARVNTESINNSQMLIIFDLLKKVDTNSIPLNYEFFVEFLMKKPTLQHKYSKRGVVLLAYSPTSIEVKGGRVFSKPKDFMTEKRDEFAKKLGFDTPVTIFDGILANFESGIQVKELKDVFLPYKNILTLTNLDNYISKITEILLKLESKYGGNPEGYVLKYNDILLKIQQPYQVDKEARYKTKTQYMGDERDEAGYWKNVRLAALEIIGNDSIKGDLNLVLKRYAEELKKFKITFTHPKKSLFQIKDDIQGNIKMIAVKRLRGNNNFLFLGKFRILSNAHYKIIKNGLRDFDGGVVCLVSSKETKEFEDLREKMLRKCFPNIEIMTRKSGHIPGIIGSAKHNINAVICGTDRYNDYVQQLQKYPDIKVIEVKRDSTDISATSIIKNLDNEILFKRNTPKEIHSLYNEIKKKFKQLNINEVIENEF